MRRVAAIFGIIFLTAISSSAAVTYSGASAPVAGRAARSRSVDTAQVQGVVGTLRRNGSRMEVSMSVALDSLGIRTKNAVLLTPAIVNGTDTLSLTPMGVYSRNRWIHYERISRDMITGAMGGGQEFSFKGWQKTGEPVQYSDDAPWSDWMDGATLSIRRRELGCCLTTLGVAMAMLDTYRGPVEFKPAMLYIRPASQAGRKERFVSGAAWIQFPVDETIIYPERYSNPAELGKIRATIDEIRSDSDITITGVQFKGYASPESPYQHNAALAKGRTEALSSYIRMLYRFPENLVTTDFEPEDWAGLRAKVDSSYLDHRAEILAIIDDPSLSPDPREAKIKASYPQEYYFMLAEWYPRLRRTEYRVQYRIVDYTDPQKARQMALESPGKLSLEEFYLACEGLDEDSVEFSDIWETAVRMYPDSETANANAAAAAISRGDLVSAGRFLERAGDSREALYSRGVLAVLSGDCDAAEGYFALASEKGADCSEALELLVKVKERGLVR